MKTKAIGIFFGFCSALIVMIACKALNQFVLKDNMQINDFLIGFYSGCVFMLFGLKYPKE